MIGAFKSRQFMIFLLTGGVAALVNFISRVIYNHWLSFSTSVILAYISGMITAFILAKLFVFNKSQQSLHQSAIFFTLVNLVAVIQTWLISMAMAYYVLPFMGVSVMVPEISHMAGIIVPVFTSYIGHKRWSFR